MTNEKFPKTSLQILRKPHSPNKYYTYDCSLCDYPVWVGEEALAAVGPPLCPRHKIPLVPAEYDDDQ
jgi:hypothetical protein